MANDVELIASRLSDITSQYYPDMVRFIPLIMDHIQKRRQIEAWKEALFYKLDSELANRNASRDKLITDRQGQLEVIKMTVSAARDMNNADIVIATLKTLESFMRTMPNYAAAEPNVIDL